MSMTALFAGLLLKGAGERVALAAVAVLIMWTAAIWAIVLNTPAPTTTVPTSAPVAPSLRLVIATGQPAPTGGAFTRFDVTAQPIVAPVNARGHVAFYASVVHSKQTEGIFLDVGSRIVKVAALGDPVPGGGLLSEFAKHPTPSLNSADKVAFGAAVSGARASEGVFLAGDGALKVIALSGNDAPGVPTGTFVEFDTPTLNDRDEVAFVATVRRGREMLQVLYLHSAGRLRKLVAEGDTAPVIPGDPTRSRGTFSKFGVPVINNKGAIVLPAVIDRGDVLGGIFVTGTRDLARLLAVGETISPGTMLVRFSERVALDDEDNIAFGAHIGAGASANSEALFVWSAASGLTQVAAIGDSAPGGGRYSAFSAWPSLGPHAAVAFVAGIDDGPGPVGLYVWRAGDTRRLAMTGDRLPDSTKLSAFALNPVASAGPNGGVTFATMSAPDNGQTGIYYFGPPPTAE
jgi:hypothetical protein